MKSLKHILLATIFVFALTGITAPAFAEEEEKKSENNQIGEVYDLEGKAGIIRDDRKFNVEVGESFILLDIAETDKDSRLNISLTDESVLSLGESSRLFSKKYIVSDDFFQGQSIFFLSNGLVRAISCQNRLEIHTPTAIAEARNRITDYTVWQSLEDSSIYCVAVFKDSVNVKNINESVEEVRRVPMGYMSCVAPDMAPTEPEVIPDDLLNTLRLKVDEARFLESCGDYPEICGICERLNPRGRCIPDSNKPCDDGDPCTIDDICVGRICKGKRDPSPIDPACEL